MNFQNQITNALSMDETEEEKVDFLDVRKSFEKDPRKVIEIEMNKDGIFSERTMICHGKHVEPESAFAP